MLKIQHPGAITREREKQVTPWEGVRLYKYANGVECQILIGQLPHGHVQSAITANRSVTLTKRGTDAHIVFGDAPLPLVDFLNGDRLTAETENALIIDSCHFIADVKVGVQYGAEAGELVRDGEHLVARFGDGTAVTVEPHGGHGHVSVEREGQALKSFFNGKDNKLYVFGPEDPVEAQ